MTAARAAPGHERPPVPAGTPQVAAPTTIRLATPQDAASLAALRWQSRTAGEQAREPFEAFAERFVRWLHAALAEGRWDVAVAELEGGLAGCMYLQRVETVPVPGVTGRAWGYVTHAFVQAPHRNRGLGAAMLGLLVRQARQRSLEELQVWPSHEAVPLYLRAGFLSPEAQRAGSPPEEASYVLPLRPQAG